LVVLVGPAVCFAIDAGTFVVSAIALAGLRTPRTVAAAAAESIVVQLRNGWREFASRRWLWLTVAYVSLFSFLVVAPFLVLGPVVMARHFGGAQNWSAVASAYGCGAVAASLAAIKIGHPRTLLVACAGLALFAAPTALLATYAPLPAIVTASAVGGIGI